MASIWQLLVQARGDSTSGQKAMKDLQKAGGKLSKALGINFSAIAHAGELALGAGLAITLKEGIGEMLESNKVTAQTGAVWKSTGAAANVSVAQVKALGRAIAAKTGIDHNQIQSGENMLLTFTKVRNEAGKGNDVFTQSTKIMTDMSVALGKSAPQSALILGKALNDPIRGLTNLRKIGVQFTDGQTAQIKAMVKSGNTMGAQKIILAELTKEFGGSANAFGKTGPGAIDRAKNAFKELSGQLVSAVMPSIAGVATKAADLVDNIQKWTQTASGKAALAKVKGVVDDLGKGIGIVVPLIVGVVKGLYDWRAVLLPIAAAIVAVDLGIRAWAVTVAVINLVKAAMVALDAAMDANPVGLVALAIVGLVAGLVTAYKESATFRGIVQEVWSVLKDLWNILMDNKQIFLLLLGPIGELAAALITAYEHSETFRDIVNAAFNAVKTVITTVINDVKTVVSAGLAIIEGFWTAHGAAIMAVVTQVWDGIKQYVQGTIEIVEGIIKTVMALVTGDWSGAWAGIQQIFQGVWDQISGIVTAALAVLKAQLDLAWAAISTAASTVWNAIKDAIIKAVTDVGTGLATATTAIPGLLVAAFSAVVAKAEAIGGDIKGKVIGAVTAIGTDVASAAAAIPGLLASAFTTVVSKAGAIGGNIVSAITGAISNIDFGAAVKGLDKAFKAACADLISAAGSVGSDIAGAIKGAINAVIDEWNNFKIPGVSVMGHEVTPSINFPNLPKLARGGITDGISIAGEAGREAVVPLGSSPRAQSDRARVMQQAGLDKAGGGLQLTQIFRSDPDPFVASRRMAFALQTAGLVTP